VSQGPAPRDQGGNRPCTTRGDAAWPTRRSPRRKS
jgi:hypothetical protein